MDPGVARYRMVDVGRRFVMEFVIRLAWFVSLMAL